MLSPEQTSDDPTSSGPTPTETDVLDVLGDADCRAILGAVADSARSATAIASASDLPLSTTYRKLNRLVAADLLVERTRLDPDRNNLSVYETAPVDVCVALATDEPIRVTVADREDGDARAD